MSLDIGREPKEYIRVKVAAGELTKEDGALIQRYVSSMQAEKGWMPHTAASNCRYIVKIAIAVPGIRGWTHQKILDYANKVRKQYRANTSRKDIMMLRVFTLWLIDQKILKGIKPEQIEKLKPTPADRMTKVAADMLTGEDIRAMIAAMKTSRDRAVIAVLSESSVRPFELIDATWGDVKFDTHGAVLNTAGKTGKPRYIRLINSAEYLLAWKNDYPHTITNDSPLFVNVNTDAYNKFTKGGLRKIIQKAAKAVPGKRVHAYLFRHSRITEMLSLGVPESVIKLQAWGSISTSMIGTYGHLSNDQQDAFLLAAANKEAAPIRKSEPALTNTVCPACGHQNPPGIAYCSVCGVSTDPVKYQEKLAESSGEVETLRKKNEEQTAQMKKMEELMEAMARQQSRLSRIVDGLRKDIAPAPMTEPLPD